MSTRKVQVKWKKEKFDVDVNITEKPSVFKAQLFALSGVLPDRQKIMMKGMALKDNENWQNFILKDGATILLMGSSEVNNLPSDSIDQTSELAHSLNSATDALLKPNLIKTDKVVFEEDITDEALAKLYDLPAGLVNLGNTCYLNSTLQCFYAVPALRERIVNYKVEPKVGISSAVSDQQESFLLALKQLFIHMRANPTDLIPFVFLQIFHSTFPEFAERERPDPEVGHSAEDSAAVSGNFRQQDANECLVRIRNILGEKLKTSSNDASAKGGNFMDKYFRGEYEVTMKPEEATAPAEMPVVSRENFYQLRCFINNEVKYLRTGIEHGLNEKVERFSQSLDRNATYSKNSLISRLPAYLIVQFERFFFKKDQRINAKIRKDIKFPMVLDLHEFCTPILKEKLLPRRQKFRDAEEKKVQSLINSNDPKPELSPDKNKTAKTAQGKPEAEIPPTSSSFEDDEGSNNSGYYDLLAVLTHQGRTSNSGHYVAWVKRNDVWMMCDDNNIKPVTEEHIMKLSGGGDWHTAYVLIYGPRILKT
ncbi:unnamed protein product [Gordionus sp. m RMFG-2023]